MAGYNPSFQIGQAEASAIRSEVPEEVGDEATFVVEITELAGSCILAIEGEDGRVNGRITDPVLAVPNNPYASGFASQQAIVVRGKPTFRNGSFLRLFISNLAQPPSVQMD